MSTATCRAAAPDGHMYTITLPNLPAKARSVAAADHDRAASRAQKYLFPLFYGRAGKGYFVVASKGGAPEHPGWYRNILANPEVEIQVGTEKMRARARTATRRGAGAALEGGASSSGRPMPTTQKKAGRARSPWSCWIRWPSAHDPPARRSGPDSFSSLIPGNGPRI